MAEYDLYSEGPYHEETMSARWVVMRSEYAPSWVSLTTSDFRDARSDAQKRTLIELIEAVCSGENGAVAKFENISKHHILLDCCDLHLATSTCTIALVTNMVL